LNKNKSLSLFLFSLLVLGAEPAAAVQQHGGAEGLVSHEIGHILFIAGMGYLLFWVYRLRMTGGGWYPFKLFLWLILAWNVLTFTGHWMHELVDPGKFVLTDGEITHFSITTLFDFLFYLTRLDHLLLVPAFFFLFLALKKWSQPI
jgi:hypothetical protein